jgi:hypothetical protein
VIPPADGDDRMRAETIRYTFSLYRATISVRFIFLSDAAATRRRDRCAALNSLHREDRHGPFV